jgi:putative oxidoreductase
MSGRSQKMLVGEGAVLWNLLAGWTAAGTWLSRLSAKECHMPPELDLALMIIGRFLVGAYFLNSGIRNLAHLDSHTDKLADSGVPQPRLVLLAGIALMILGGLSVGLSLWPGLGALALIVFTIAATVLYHNFWAFSGPERASKLNSVISNAAMTGGLLVILATA